MLLLSLPVPGRDANGNPLPPRPVTVPFTVPVTGAVTVTGPTAVTVRDVSGTVVAGPGTPVTFAAVPGIYVLNTTGGANGYLTATLAPDTVAPVLLSPSGGDDGPVVTAAATKLADRGGGVLQLTGGTFRVATPITWQWGNVHLVGSGSETVLQAVDAISSVLSVEVGAAGRGRFADFVVDGNGLCTASPLAQSITAETSVGTVFDRVEAKGSTTTFQWSNSGCEDCSYNDCSIPGDEADVSSIPPAFDLSVPDGACYFRGGALFGTMQVEAQLATFEGLTFGPLYCNNPTPTVGNITVNGCYLYDGATHNCVDTGTNLYSLKISGSYLVSRGFTAWANGNLPAGANVTLAGNTYVYPPGTSGDVYALSASGAGYLTIEGSTLDIGSATWNHFLAVNSATTVVTAVSGP